MTHEIKMALHAELSKLGRKIVQCIEANKDYSEFEARFKSLDEFLQG